MSLSLDTLLDDLQRQGQLDSSGRFTLDAAKARMRLREFRLPDPYSYVLKLLQAAVAGRATAFHLKSSTARVAFEMPGIRLPIEELANVFHNLLDETGASANQALRHLAVGLHAALGTRASQIEVRYRDGSRGVHLKWTPYGQQFAEWKTPGAALCQVELKRMGHDFWREVWEKVNQRFVGDMLFGGDQAKDREQRMLSEGGDLAPIPVTVNRRTLEKGSNNLKMYLPGLFSFHRTLYADSRWLIGLGGPGIQVAPRFQAREAQDGVQGGLIARPLTRTGAHRLLIVRDGALICRANYRSENPEMLAIVDGHLLNMDLTSMQIVEDDRWSRLVSTLEELARHFDDQQIGELWTLEALVY